MLFTEIGTFSSFCILFSFFSFLYFKSNSWNIFTCAGRLFTFNLVAVFLKLSSLWLKLKNLLSVHDVWSINGFWSYFKFRFNVQISKYELNMHVVYRGIEIISTTSTHMEVRARFEFIGIICCCYCKSNS